VCTAPNGTPACADSACTIGACNPGFADCDRNLANGCEVNTQVDPGNCSACGVVCSPANAAPACLTGMCAIAACMPGFANCDGNVANGCEVNVGTDANNCGGCGIRCSIANGTGACNAGLCAVAACSPGYMDCDGNPANGCEVNVANDPNHCGTCTNVCSVVNGTPACSGGTCTVGGCGVNFSDCNHNPADGCETNTSANPLNCGACNHMCFTVNATPGCMSGNCTIAACNSGYANCNGNPLDGCETNIIGDVNNCGACGNHCFLPNANATCTGTCRISACLGTYVDTDGNPANGCECLPDTISKTCTLPSALATLAPGQSTMASGTIPQVGVSDWFQVTFTGNTNTAFHPFIRFTANPNTLMRFDIATNCGGGLLPCGTEGSGSSALTAWEMSYTGVDATHPNFNPIPLPGSSGAVWIRVYRSAVATAGGCGTYTLTVSD
jgi:hypothetical protein